MEDIKINEAIVKNDLGHEDAEDKPGRSRTWMLLLYPEHDETGVHKRIIEETLDELDWNYAGRVHDQDEGTRLHHHVVIYFANGRQKEDVAKDLGLDTKWLRRWHSQKRAMRYLCHRDNKDKFQYDPSGIYGTLADKAVGLCSKGDAMSEVEGVTKLVNIINEYPGYLTVTTLLPIALAEGLYSHYRRLGNSLFKLLDEHNGKWSDRDRQKAEQGLRDSAYFQGFVAGHSNKPTPLMED